MAVKGRQQALAERNPLRVLEIQRTSARHGPVAAGGSAWAYVKLEMLENR